jgi:putative component of toxin-antitoxin plasmid stabilization module
MFNEQVNLRQLKGEQFTQQDKAKLYGDINYQLQVLRVGESNAKAISKEHADKFLESLVGVNAEQAGTKTKEFFSNFSDNPQMRKKQFDALKMPKHLSNTLADFVNHGDEKTVSMIVQAYSGNIDDGVMLEAAKNDTEVVKSAKAYAEQQVESNEMFQLSMVESGAFGKNVKELRDFKEKMKTAVAYGKLNGIDVLGKFNGQYERVQVGGVGATYSQLFTPNAKGPLGTDVVGGWKADLVFHKSHNISETAVKGFTLERNAQIGATLLGVSSRALEEVLKNPNMQKTKEVKTLLGFVGVADISRNETTGAINVVYENNHVGAEAMKEISAFLSNSATKSKDPTSFAREVQPKDFEKFVQSKVNQLARVTQEFGTIRSTSDGGIQMYIDHPSGYRGYFGQSIPNAELMRLTREWQKNNVVAKTTKAVGSAVKAYEDATAFPANVINGGK